MGSSCVTRICLGCFESGDFFKGLLGNRRGCGVALVRDEAAFGNGVSDDTSEEAVRADGVVVSWDGERHDFRVDVGVDDSHDRDTELASFGDCNVLLVRVEHENRVRSLLQVAHSTEVALQLDHFTLEKERFFLDHDVELAGSLHALVLEHLVDALTHRLEVREHATEPTLVDVGHATFVGIALDRVLSLLLGSDEQDGAATGDEITDVPVGRLDSTERLLEVDDVNAGALSENETLHFRVPTAGLVAEVCSGFQHLTHADNSHVLLLVRLIPEAGARFLGRATAYLTTGTVMRC